MNFKKKLFLLIGIFTLFFIGGIQYIRINKNAPKGYIIDKNTINKEITLDNLSIKFLDFKENPDGDMGQTQEYNVFIELRNITNNDVNCMEILYSKLSLGVYNVEYSMPICDIKKMKTLKPNEKIDVVLKYALDKKQIAQNSKEQFVFYINPSLYKSEVEEVYRMQRKFYSKCAVLGGVYDEKDKK